MEDGVYHTISGYKIIYCRFIYASDMFQSSFSMFNMNSGLMSKVTIWRSFYLTLHGYIRTFLVIFVYSNCSFYHCTKRKTKTKRGTCDDMWRPECRVGSDWHSHPSFLLFRFSLRWTVEVFKKPDLCEVVSLSVSAQKTFLPRSSGLEDNRRTV